MYFKLFRIGIFMGLLSFSTFSIAKGTKNWLLHLSGGYTTQDFNSGSLGSFSKIQHYIIDFNFQWRRKWYGIGLGYSTIPSINISSYKLSTGETGSYKLSFSQTYLSLAAHYKMVYASLLLGTESPMWVGSPDLGYQAKSHALSGLELGYTGLKSKKLNFPIWLRYLSKPEREFTFQNYTADSIIIKSGIELIIAGGLRFEF